MNRRRGRGHGSDTSERSQQPRPEQAECQWCHRHPGWGRARSQVTKADEPPPHPAAGVLRAAPCSQGTRPSSHPARRRVRACSQNKTKQARAQGTCSAGLTRRDGAGAPGHTGHRARGPSGSGGDTKLPRRGLLKAPRVFWAVNTSPRTPTRVPARATPLHTCKGSLHPPPPVEETGKTRLWGHPLAALQASLGQPGPAPCRRERPGWTRTRGGGETCPPSCDGSSRAPPCPPGRQTPPAPFLRGASGGPGRVGVCTTHKGRSTRGGPGPTSSSKLKLHAAPSPRPG